MQAMKEPKGQPAQIRWERRTQNPLLALSVLYAVAFAIPIVAPGADEAVKRACLITEWLVWGAYAFDYLTRLALAPYK
jgi:voltage-gated potassium channel